MHNVQSYLITTGGSIYASGMSSVRSADGDREEIRLIKSKAATVVNVRYTRSARLKKIRTSHIVATVRVKLNSKPYVSLTEAVWHAYMRVTGWRPTKSTK